MGSSSNGSGNNILFGTPQPRPKPDTVTKPMTKLTTMSSKRPTTTQTLVPPKPNKNALSVGSSAGGQKNKNVIGTVYLSPS